MKRITLTLLSAIAFCIGLVACGGAQAATSNEFVSIDSYTGAPRVFSVDRVRMVTATPSQFVLQYNDGNVSDAFPDNNGQLFAKLKAFAPALKTFVQIGTSGVWIDPDAARKIQCQYGTSTPGQPSTAGDHLYLVWTPPGYLLAEDIGCVTFNAIKAASN
jgi:hypothetical protein